MLAAGVADSDGGADDVTVPLASLIDFAAAEDQRQMSMKLEGAAHEYAEYRKLLKWLQPGPWPSWRLRLIAMAVAHALAAERASHVDNVRRQR